MSIIKHAIRGVLLESIFKARNLLRKSATDFFFNRKTKQKTIEPVHHQTSSPKVLFIRLDGKYGDSIVSQFALEKIKRELNAEIYVLTKNKQTIDFFSEIVDQFIICKKPRRVFHLLKAYQEIKNIHFSYVVHLDKNIKDRELIFLRYLKTNSIIVADSRIKFANKYLIQPNELIHFRERCVNLLNAMHVPTNPDESTHIKVPLKHIERLKKITNDLKNIIYFNPYGAGSQRQLSKEKIEAMTHSMQAIFPDSNILIQSKEPSSLAINEQNKNLFLFQTNEFVDIISMIEICDFVVSVDTATTHVASALDKHSIVLYHENKNNYTEWHADSSKSLPIFSTIEVGKLPHINNFSQNEFNNLLLTIKSNITQA